MNRLNKRVKEGFPAKAGSNVMKKRWEMRAAGFTVALMMMVCLVMTALPAAAAGMTATFTVSPKTISAGYSISATVAVANAAVGTASADVTVQGLGSFGGTYTDNVAFTDGAATINVPTGHISYGGKDSPAYLQIIVGGESVTSQSISGISPIPDDGGDTPTTPPAIAGSLFTIVEGTPVPTIDAGKTAKLTYPIESSKRISGDVQISAKLPEQISIPTPVGGYTPDWAIVFQKKTGQLVFAVVETGSAGEELEMPPVQAARLSCAEKFFSGMPGGKIRFCTAASVEELCSRMGLRE